ncbi:MAG: hypothetical protein DBX52_02610 [Clostridiales bacterium]|nr:MAG: hypothetical protein DBX52_02595 [Clostridiales bacterium]PWM40740.1 MAG: hypothetical protein DBX52_02610 [Clostridiales bacterium]
MKDYNQQKEIYETCILCGVKTSVPRSAPVAARACYVPGCGQLCRECYSKLESKDPQVQCLYSGQKADLTFEE